MEQELNEQLEHHGTKGMKWGERRYQYKDGSLTPAGKKRYAKDVERLKAKNEKLANKIKGKKAQEAAMKRVAKLKAEAEAKKQALRDMKNPAAKAGADAPAPSKKEAKKAAKAEAAAAKKATRDEEILKSANKDDAAMAEKKLKIARSGDVRKIVANSHLFTDKEIADLKLRVENEQAILNKIPKSKSGKFFDVVADKLVIPASKDAISKLIDHTLNKELNLEKAKKEAAEAAAKAKKEERDYKDKQDALAYQRAKDERDYNDRREDTYYQRAKDAYQRWKDDRDYKDKQAQARKEEADKREAESREKMIMGLSKAQAAKLIEDNKLSYAEIDKLNKRFNFEDLIIAKAKGTS